MTSRASRITVQAFQPFRSRVGLDTVVGLTFPFNAGAVAEMKAALDWARDDARRRGLPLTVGGWLGDRRCWFVERSAWPVVREFLLDRGYQFMKVTSDGRATLLTRVARATAVDAAAGRGTGGAPTGD
jgi:hypothetical protein